MCSFKFGGYEVIKSASQLIVDAREEHTILMVLHEQVFHCFQCRASCHKIIEHDAVLLTWQHVEREHCPNTLLAMAMRHIFVKGNG